MLPIIVEFTGLPGAGKTTIARAVISALTTKGYECFPPETLSNRVTVEQKGLRQLLAKLEVLYHLIFCLVKYHCIVPNALRYALQVTPSNLAGLRRVLMLVTRLELIGTVVNDGHDFLVFDEGLVQNIWSIAITGNPPPDEYLLRLLKDLLGDRMLTIILVDVDIDVAVKRMEKRSSKHSRFDRMSPIKARELLSKHKKDLEHISNCAVALKKADYLKVEGSRPIEDNVYAVVHFADRLWRVQKGLDSL